MVHKLSCKIGNDELVLETGRMAKQANGAVFATFGGSAVIATACASDKVTEGLDFVPLTVEYNEKFYAAGKIPGGFIKRETRPKDREILVSRIIDRPMRPLFDKAFGREIQVVPTCISFDTVNPPDILGLNAASAAVHISDIPFAGPIAGVRVALVDGQYLVNPTQDQIKASKLEIVVAGTAGGITMVEGHAGQASEEEMLGAIEVAKKPIADICALIVKLRELAGKDKLPLAPLKIELNKRSEIEAFARGLLQVALFTKEKLERQSAVSAAKKAAAAKFADALTDEVQKKLFEALMETAAASRRSVP
jgi:polyribonucleotide nucleotidyltransferase